MSVGKEALEVTNACSCLPTLQATQKLQTSYRENLDLIYRYVYSKVGNREEAEDLTAQVFLKAVRTLDHKRSPQSARKWLFQVAHTTVVDYWRAHYRVAMSSLDVLLENSWEGPAEEDPFGIRGKPTERVQRIFEALPARYREVLTCRFLLSLSIQETAVRMGLTEANVKAVQFRALKRAAEVDHVVGASLREAPQC